MACTGYEFFLRKFDILDHGFSYGELVRDGSVRHVLPDSLMWERMVPTLRMAIALRQRMVETYNIRGLLIAAAYRPSGGALSSQHKVNAALDLDLTLADRHLQRAWYTTAVQHWCEYGRQEKMGLGLYCAPGATGGVRVHIDTGYALRTWQHHKGQMVTPPAAHRICVAMGWDIPKR